MTPRLIDISRHLDAVVPMETKNAIGIRVWRDLIATIQQALDDAIQGINDAGNAQTAADNAQTTADNAQTTADNNAADIVNLATDLSLLDADFASHETLQADLAVLGHIFKSAAIAPLTTPLVGAAPLVYTPVHSDAIVARLEDIISRVADLETKLQTAGILA